MSLHWGNFPGMNDIEKGDVKICKIRVILFMDYPLTIIDLWWLKLLIYQLFLNFSEAQKLVEDMEKERRKLDKQLDVVQEKTKRAYLSQEILEAKMKVLFLLFDHELRQSVLVTVFNYIVLRIWTMSIVALHYTE